MHVIRGRNVHEILPAGLEHLAAVGIPTKSRAGDVLVAPGPVTTVYTHPTERVLFWPQRDANPFFHFFEALWMLSGRNDLAFLTQFVKRFENYSNDGKTLNGAYGFRWRRHFGFDQIQRVIELLRSHPLSRRAALAMWDPQEDCQTDELALDIPCNTMVYFDVSYGRRDEPNRLNITVMCRSNDIIWGAYGANAVHFSFLQEYMAAALNLTVGTLYQISNNYHAYTDVFKKVFVPSDYYYDDSPYKTGEVQPYPLVQDFPTWDRDLALFMEDPTAVGFNNPFFSQVAKPLWWTHKAAKRGAYANALEIIAQCKASDWRRAAEEWIQRRWTKRNEHLSTTSGFGLRNP